MKEYRWTWGVISKIPFSTRHFFFAIGIPKLHPVALFLFIRSAQRKAGMESLHALAVSSNIYVGFMKLTAAKTLGILRESAVMERLNFAHLKRRGSGRIRSVFW